MFGRALAPLLCRGASSRRAWFGLAKADAGLENGEAQ
jgi:hypothetical protein